ncbi:MAG: hypothetical protein J5983_05270 [Ruminococcus sp.]|nr:hypothetical protein [Ruminococcus sp.]
MKKDKGLIEYSLSLIFLMICIFVVLLVFSYRRSIVERYFVEDGLAASTLAAAIIDTDIYGETEELIISDTDGAYLAFKQTLKTNLGLDNNYMPANTTFMESQVGLLEFRVYNVKDGIVTETFYDDHGNKQIQVLGSTAVTPNGKEVESTTVYSKIEFDVKGYMNHVQRQTMEYCADVVKN